MIHFESKEFSEYQEKEHKPSLLRADRNVPFERLHYLDFEDLTYFTIKHRIEKDGPWEGFDEIRLLGGVKDQGRDCSLHRNGQVHGVIQCKHSAKASVLGKTKFIKEILKFLLFAVKDPRLLPVPSDFTYYILASGGVNSETQTLIDQFNEDILLEDHLSKWVEEILQQFSSLKPLDSYANVKERLHYLLAQIAVKQLLSRDIDMLLQETYNSVVKNRFFQLQPVVATEDIKALLKRKDEISYDQALRYLNSASFDFRQIKSHFGEQTNTHIVRKVTGEVYAWVLADLSLNQENIAILEANAGMGKSVVFKDVYKLALKDEIPVLTIKADKCFAEDRIFLSRKLFQREHVDFDSLIEALREKHQKIIVLVDQIDALSQTLSSNRSFLTTYNRLIDDLSRYPEVRIIVSVRSFDLNYDSELSIYKKARYSCFQLQPLPRESVTKILDQYGAKQYSDSFIELVSIPNALNIFCQLRNKKSRNLDNLKNLNDLNNALWEDIIDKASEQHLNVIPVIYQIARKMYSEGGPYLQDISQTPEVKFLKSHSLITQDQRGLQFFHQTFYNYVFARYFVETEQDLCRYVIDKGQSLYIRSTIKMVLEFLRDASHNSYIQTLKRFLSSKSYRFHLQVLVLQSLSMEEAPTKEELKIFDTIIHPDITFFEVFTEQVLSRNWLNHLIQGNIILQNLDYKTSGWSVIVRRMPWRLENKKETVVAEKRYRIGIQILLNNVRLHSDLIIGFLMQLPEDYSNKAEVIQRVLIALDDWKNPILKGLFKTYIPFEGEESYEATLNRNFWYFQCLQRIAVYHAEFVIDEIEPKLFKEFLDNYYYSGLGYEYQEVIKKIMEHHPQHSLEFFLHLMIETVQANPIPLEVGTYETPLIHGNHFTEAGFQRHSKNADDEIFEFLMSISSNLVSDLDWFSTQFEKYKHSNLIPLLTWLLCNLTLCVNKYRKEALELLEIIHEKNGFKGYDNAFQLVSRQLIAVLFPLLDQTQQERLTAIIFSVSHPYELRTYQDGDQKVHTLEIYGKKLYLFLEAIPLTHRIEQPRLQKRYQELSRKFGDLHIQAMDVHRGGVTGVGPPLKANAYENMTFEQWLISMHKFDDNYRRPRTSGKGGIDHHSREFEKQVAARPIKYFPFVEAIALENKVAISYQIAGIQGLANATYDPYPLLSLFKEIIKRAASDWILYPLIQLAEYFNRQQHFDQTVFDFLKNLALSGRKFLRTEEYEPLKDDDAIRAFATTAVINSNYHDEVKNEIFQVVETNAKAPIPTLQISILSGLAYLNRLNPARAFKIFKTLTQTADLELLKNSIWSAQFYLQNFGDQLDYYFEKILKREELHEHGVVLITKYWLFHRSTPFLQRAIVAGDKARGAIVYTLEHHLFKNGVLQEKPFQLLIDLLSYDGKVLAQKYSGMILRLFKPSNFKAVLPFLKAYIQSEHIKSEPRYLVMYLKQSAREYPIECLELMEQCLPFRPISIQHRGYMDKEPIQAVLAIFSSLHKKERQTTIYNERILNLFDKLLQNQMHRHSTLEAINTL